MTFYLAARYSRRDWVREVAAELRRMGHTVTSGWLDTDYEITERGSTSCAPAEREQVARNDMGDLQAAECVVSFTEPPGPNPGRGGRHVEFGLAYAWGKRCVVIGHRENVFHHLPEVEFYPSVWDWMRALGAPQP